MNKIIQPLTREFLQAHGIEFNGATWSNPNTKFELTATDEENTWIVTIPGLPANIPQPEPIKNYCDLMRLYVSVIGGYVQEKQAGKKFADQREQFKNIADLLAEFFSFDKCISLRLNVTVHGVSIVPGNAYTHTLMGGNEFGFVVKVKVNDKEQTFEHSIAPECISTMYLEDLVRNDLNLTKEDTIEILEVWIDNLGNKERFFGSGLNFGKMFNEE